MVTFLIGLSSQVLCWNLLTGRISLFFIYSKSNLHTYGYTTLVAGKYLKQLYDIHNNKCTLEIDKHNIYKLCPKCRNTPVCIEWSTEQKLTCFCLESVF